MKIKEFDPTNIKQVRDLIKVALKDFKENHGFSLSFGKISYNNEKFTTRLVGSFNTTQIATIVERPKILNANLQINTCCKRKRSYYRIINWNKGLYCISIINNRGKKYNVKPSFFLDSKFITLEMFEAVSVKVLTIEK